MHQGLHGGAPDDVGLRIHRAPATPERTAELDDGVPGHWLQRLGGGNHRTCADCDRHDYGAGKVLEPFQPDVARRQRDLHGYGRQDASDVQPQGCAAATASAASTIRRVTSFGREIMTTCEAPLTTTVFTDFARSAMKASAAAGMFLSRSP